MSRFGGHFQQSNNFNILVLPVFSLKVTFLTKMNLFIHLDSRLVEIQCLSTGRRMSLEEGGHVVQRAERRCRCLAACLTDASLGITELRHWQLNKCTQVHLEGG